MDSVQHLTGAQWRKSTYSGTSGGDCIECAPLNGATWLKSSHSGNTGGECIEFAQAQRNGNATVGVRDSKNPGGPILTVTPTAFTHFVSAAISGDLSRPSR
ncbi:DUF397 domain-containing protein [Streptomyces kanamyceticus]|uniref:DUF397 domain-containing protein n=1 Tax=Streptomyces kanamyceticus TaxID=1967 RepID=A0A5J6GGI8_STRKN|nr:DUF397 domain-containing protein [Streptomyces kanamyceticus]QEU93015.1 DUF397 domain-containing protein [Streptomyces kanamyceticus]